MSTKPVAGEATVRPDFTISTQLHGAITDAAIMIMPAPMILIDTKGTILHVGAGIIDMFGYSEAELLGSNVKMLMASFHASQHDEYLQRYIDTGKRNIIGSTRIENAQHKDGGLFPIELSVGEAIAEGKHYFLGFIKELSSDESNRRAMQSMLAELAHASRVSAMAALATSIAHELNQPLTTITNYSEGLRDMLRERPEIDGVEEMVRILDSCGQQAVRAGQLLHGMQEFMKSGSIERERVSIDRLIDDSIALALINGFRRSVRLDTSISPDLPDVYINQVQAQQVLFNLILNAFEAMNASQGGLHPMQVLARAHEGGFVEFRVEDSGPGVPEELQNTIFDSFVSTKGNGMGVGLAICRQIVEAHQGQIWLEKSDRLGGAAICFTLPTAGADIDKNDRAMISEVA